MWSASWRLDVSTSTKSWHGCCLFEVTVDLNHECLLINTVKAFFFFYQFFFGFFFSCLLGFTIHGSFVIRYPRDFIENCEFKVCPLRCESN